MVITFFRVPLNQSYNIAADSILRQFGSRQHGEYKDTGVFNNPRSLVPLERGGRRFFLKFGFGRFENFEIENLAILKISNLEIGEL